MIVTPNFLSTMMKLCYENGRKAGFESCREQAARAAEKSYRHLTTKEFEEQTTTQARREAAQCIRALTYGDLDPMHVTPQQTPPLASRT